MKNKIASYILSYEITKGMKSFGPIGLLKPNNNAKELVLHQIDNVVKFMGDRTDISIIAGFGHEKLQKKIPSHINIILNNYFLTTNQGYAFKLIIDNYDHKKYDGLFITSIDTMIRCKKNKILNTDQSWIVSQKIKKNQPKHKFLGSVSNANGNIEYIFYDIGTHIWSGMVYLCNKDLTTIANNIDTYYDNMFLFEIINKSIGHNICYKELALNHDELIHITGLKDKNKIKEYA
jgi:hypothetical protein